MVLKHSLWLVVACTFCGCASEDPHVERRGGTIPDLGDGGAAAAEPIPFCSALEVIRAKCQRCHTDPPANGAPAPFLTYDDLVADFGFTGKPFTAFMVGDIESGFMPYVTLNDPPTSIMPPVDPLTAAEKTTLLGWLKQGALPGGGTDCP